MAANFIKQGVGDANTKSKGWIGVVVAVMVIIAIVMVVKALYNASKNGGLTLGEEAGKQIIAAQTGITPARQSVCKDVAEKTSSALYVIWGRNTIFTYDSQDLIYALNRLTTSQETIYTSILLQQIRGFGLRKVLNSIEATHKEKINQIVTQNAT